MDDFEFYTQFMAIRLHFDNKTDYDYHHFKGRTTHTEDSFNDSRDRFKYVKLHRELKSKNIDIEKFMVANAYHNPMCWVGELLNDSASYDRYYDLRKRMETVEYHLREDVKRVLAEKHPFKSVDGYSPDICGCVLRREVHAVSFVHLDHALGLIDKFDGMRFQDPLWDQEKFKLKKLRSFIDTDDKLTRKIVEQELCQR